MSESGDNPPAAGGDDPPPDSGEDQLPARRNAPSVVRSTVPAGLPYTQYRRQLRRDFFYTCAYCGMMETEAQGISFAIDHYEPMSAREDLANEYSNLMYCCTECNSRKGDRYPPPEARADGHRFFRADEDVRVQHFKVEGIELQGVTNVGKYTVDAVDLNRETVTRIRKMRRELLDYDGFIDEGATALAEFALDKLQPKHRERAKAAIKQVLKTAEDVLDDFNEVLRRMAMSVVLHDLEPGEDEIERDKARLARLKNTEAIYPNVWRGRAQKKGKKRKKWHGACYEAGGMRATLTAPLMLGRRALPGRYPARVEQSGSTQRRPFGGWARSWAVRRTAAGSLQIAGS